MFQRIFLSRYSSIHFTVMLWKAGCIEVVLCSKSAFSTHSHTNANTHEHARCCTNTHSLKHAHTHTLALAQALTRTHTHKHTYKHPHTLMRAGTHTHTHTHTHTRAVRAGRVVFFRREARLSLSHSISSWSYIREAARALRHIPARRSCQDQKSH